MGFLRNSAGLTRVSQAALFTAKYRLAEGWLRLGELDSFYVLFVLGLFSEHVTPAKEGMGQASLCPASHPATLLVRTIMRVAQAQGHGETDCLLLMGASKSHWNQWNLQS